MKRTLFTATLLILCINICNSNSIDTNTRIATELRNGSQQTVKPSDILWWDYFREGNYQHSLKVLDLTLELIALQDSYQIVDYYNRAGSLHNRLGDYEKSEYYAGKAYEVARRNNDTSTQLRALKNFVSLYSSHDDTETIDRGQFVNTMGINTTVLDSSFIALTSLAQQYKPMQCKWNFIGFLSIGILLITVLVALALLFYRSTQIATKHCNELLKLQKEIQQLRNDEELEKNNASEKLASDVRHLFETEKLYRHQGLIAEDVAKRLQTTPRQLSNAINYHYQRNFNEYVNLFRVEEATEMLKQQHEGGKYATYTIEAIGRMVGFNHKSPFYAAFKRIIGVTPLEYLENASVEEIEELDVE